MIDFILNEDGTPKELACDCDRAAIKQSLTRYITNRIQTHSFGTVEENNLEGLCCGYCKSTITESEVEQRLQELDKTQETS